MVDLDAKSAASIVHGKGGCERSVFDAPMLELAQCLASGPTQLGVIAF
ncbi:unannotated protein [freshwater metagenome]|uniref:Unannotated protein n=1 Tax=freshwater metagenome TaxID=449393 RepID=A0A6J6FEP2_9ZZZZ